MKNATICPNVPIATNTLAIDASSSVAREGEPWRRVGDGAGRTKCTLDIGLQPLSFAEYLPLGILPGA
jgi:hypothetical protein